ncbi:hypothetical protein A2U01_0104172, partial [Trifolium medium]|nr:hypothetical protein [Trifolium medium]
MLSKKPNKEIDLKQKQTPQRGGDARGHQKSGDSGLATPIGVCRWRRCEVQEHHNELEVYVL